MDLTQRANSGLHAHVVERIQLIEPRIDAVVLDVGCGTGALLAELQRNGYRRLLGLDIAPPPPFGDIEFLEVDLDDCRTGLPDASIDLAVAVEVIEHVENLGSLLTELHRVLAPNGRMLFTTPNVHSLEARIRWLFNAELKQFDQVGDPTHVMPIFEFPFRRVLARHGLAIQDSWGFPVNGFSPTSRPALRGLASMVRLLRLRGAPSGDQWCMVLEKTRAAAATDFESKRRAVTHHYGRAVDAGPLPRHEVLLAESLDNRQSAPACQDCHA
jgi:2-polyprenyl-3-methyl-5-hydroxy-6-metoxy-1,4-benzoquinol methylase